MTVNRSGASGAAVTGIHPVQGSPVTAATRNAGLSDIRTLESKNEVTARN